MPCKSLRFFLMIIVLFFLVSCDSGRKSGEDGSSANATLTSSNATNATSGLAGGRIVLGMLGEPSNLIPFLATDGASHEVADLLYVAPLKYDENIKLIPWAAENFEILDGGRKLRFVLKKGIRWHDGVELTADDVLFTYRTMINPKTPTAYSEDYKNVSKFKVLDKYSFEVEYDVPFARSLVTWAHAIMPRHVLEKQDLMNTKYSRAPIGAGPYKIKEWSAGRQIVVEANPDYFEGRANLDQVVYRFIPDISTMFLELKSGNLDMMNLTPQQYLRQTSGEKWDTDYKKYKYLSFSYTYVGFNLKSPFFGDKKVRQAFAHAIDKNEIIKGVLLGEGMPTTGPYKPGTWVYNDKIKDYPYDPEKARSLLAEAGWKPGAGGVLFKDGKPFEFTLLTNQGNDLRIKSATIIQNRLRSVGVKMNVRTVEWAAFIKEFIDKGKFDATLLGWNIVQDPDLFDVWHSGKTGPGALNFIGFKNKEVDELLEKGRRTLDQGERKKIYDRFQEILHEEEPYLFLYVPMSLPIIRADFQGIKPAPAGITYNFIKWWLPADKRKATPQK